MKKLYSFLFLVFVSVFLVSCGTKPAEQTTNIATQTGGSENISVEKTEVSAETFAETLSKTSKKLTETNEFNACLTPYVNMCAESTATEVARKDKNLEICTELSGETSQNSCRFGAVLSDMTNHKDVSQCDVITDENLKISCRATIVNFVATEANDAGKCDELTTLYIDPTAAVSAKETCVLGILTRKENLQKTECSVFSDESMKNLCISFAETAVQK